VLQGESAKTMKRYFHTVVVSAAMLMVAGTAVRAAAPVLDVEKAARVKAAYVLNFIRYSQWPDDAFEGPDSPIVVTAVGECEGANVLAEVIRRSPPTGNRQIMLEHAPYPFDDADRKEFYRSLDQSHLVYVCSTGPEPIAAILEHLNGSKTLTVGDTPDFVESGGMIGFVLEQDRILFQANPKAIQKSRVTISAKVLKLAKIVGGGDAP
jgi:hypothetical protein